MDSNLYSLITDEIFLGVVVFSLPERNCTFINKTARGYLEYTEQDPHDLKFQSMIPESSTPSDRMRYFNEDFVASEGLTQDVIVKKSNGHVFVADIGVKILTAANKDYLLLMIKDVTLQKKMQRDLTAKQAEIQNAFAEILEQNKQLKELDRAKDKFIALTTHELRTPLSAMIATSEVLTMKLYDSEEELHNFIKTIHSEGLHLLEIVNDILDFAKIQAGKMEFYIEEIDLVKFIQNQINSFEHMAEAKDVTIQLDSSESTFLAYFDSQRFRQALDNVINNAIKFTALSTPVTIQLKNDDSFVYVMIEDHGPGIPLESRDKVFNEFETVGNVNSHHKGTGLGMPITKKLMESMGGAIKLDSTVGKGSVFTLLLPRNKILNEDLYRPRPQHTDDLAA